MWQKKNLGLASNLEFFRPTWILPIILNFAGHPKICQPSQILTVISNFYIRIQLVQIHHFYHWSQNETSGLRSTFLSFRVCVPLGQTKTDQLLVLVAITVCTLLWRHKISFTAWRSNKQANKQPPIYTICR